jgi:energy-coupling factor transport system ATP-binding protein
LAIAIENVWYSYSQDYVLQEVTVTFEEGKVHLLLGPTGSGKTTLALVMAGLLRPQRGTVLVDDIDPASKQFIRSKVQLAFQFPEAQIFEMTVGKEMAYGLKNFGHGPESIQERSLWALGRVGLSKEMLTRDPGSLSFGERRKVALASVIAIKPAYLILDEPFAGLDWNGRQSLVDTVRGLKDEGLTTIILTHETDVSADLGDTVTVVVDRTAYGPCSVTGFLYGNRRTDQSLIPGFARTLHLLEAAGFEVPEKPRTVDGVAAVIGAMFADPGKPGRK